MSRSSDEIDKQAARWALQLDSGHLEPEEEERLEQWLADDVRHAGALGRAVGAISYMDRLGDIGLTASDLSETPTWTRRRVFLGGGALAGLAAAASVGLVLWKPRGREDFVTKIGETASVTLADGSTVVLNTCTRISVNFSKNERRIYLADGEAIFEVAKDKSRPFIVVAGDTNVRAVGTKFKVSRLTLRPVQVLVQEGVVEVSGRGVSGTTRIRAAARTKAMVSANQSIAAQPISVSEMNRDLAWQHGRIEFSDATLADAAEEFARYNGTKIAVDPSVSAWTITGSFVARDPVAFAKAAAAVHDLRFEVENNQVRIFRGASGSTP